MSYSDSLDLAISNVKQQTTLMQRCLQHGRLMDALKHSSALLTELRNPHLLPKQYYELYILVFDALSALSAYLVDSGNVSGDNNGSDASASASAAAAATHLADLYELVQYAGNVVPRLYLMITVGTSYLRVPGAPREEILKDMLEMCRGVQNPMRGLFLRYYLSQRTKQLLVEGDTPEALEFNCQFLIANFIEMNKMWVRLQHQGPLREREQRAKERRELQILVGAQIVRLSQLVDNNVEIYAAEILPVVLAQVVQCRDVLCQEYLYDVVCQVFPDEFHLRTLDTLLQTTLQLNAQTSVARIVLTLVDRLNGYVQRLRDNDSDAHIPATVFDTFWEHLTKLNEERPDLGLMEITGIVRGLMTLSLTWYPDNLQNIDKLLGLAAQKCNDEGGAERDPESVPRLVELLAAPDASEGEVDARNDAQQISHNLASATYYYGVITQCPSFIELLVLLDAGAQVKVVARIIECFVSVQAEKPATLQIESKDQLERLLRVVEPLVKSGAKQDTVTGQLAQEQLAKFCHLIAACLPASREYSTVEKRMEALLMLKNVYHRGGRGIRHTYPAIITCMWREIRRCAVYEVRIRGKRDYYRNLNKQTFKYVARCISDLFNVCCGASSDGSSSAAATDLVYKLNLASAALADELSLEEIAYNFFSEAFAVFEDSLSDARSQWQALVSMAQTLQKTRSLHVENYYSNLAVRTTLHGSKLLRKQDQCRAVYACSHLWWATEIAAIGEEEGRTETFFREGKRVLECLQRSLRAADSLMDNVESCELMVEILNVCLYYFIHGEEQTTHVGVGYINGLIELVKTNLRSLQMEQEQEQEQANANGNGATVAPRYVMALDGTYVQVPESNNASSAATQTKLKDISINEMVRVPVEHFQRTCTYIENQRDIDARFQTVVL
ncbi:retromer subunit [Maudiozyma humilis]|uniref:Vacuolar protein sorting-associated protein 35 n=1 Tax=Maudiozyma humilis TaxID=51915 RepID=A0AAV5RTV8_MAUHU|nr:retromer subunit [Kazachstania humilis]